MPGTRDRLTAWFLPHLPDGLDMEGRDRLETDLEQVMSRARDLSDLTASRPDELLAFLAERCPPRGLLKDRLRGLRVEDLTLAWACSLGDEAAIEIVERDHLDVVRPAISQLPDALPHLSEIKQQLRDRLFTGGESRRPKIAQYTGRGDLRSWIRVAAIRCGLDLLRAQKREVALPDDMLSNLAAADGNVELGYLKQLYQADFKTAFEGALASLESRERNLLRYHYLEKLNIDQIGTIFDVHRATVARWLTRTRDTLMTRTRATLMRQLKVGKTEFESIMRLIQSRLDASIERLL